MRKFKIENGLKTMSIEVIKKLDEANKKLDTLLLWREKVEERCKSHIEQTKEVRAVLFNNPGLKAQVQTLMNNSHNTSRWRDFYLGTFKIVIAALIVSLVIWLLTIYRPPNM